MRHALCNKLYFEETFQNSSVSDICCMMTSLHPAGWWSAVARALSGSQCSGYRWAAEARANTRLSDFMAPKFSAWPVGVNLSDWNTIELNGSQLCDHYSCFDVSLRMQTMQDRRRAAGCPAECIYPQERTNRGAQGAKPCADGQASRLTRLLNTKKKSRLGEQITPGVLSL